MHGSHFARPGLREPARSVRFAARAWYRRIQQGRTCPAQVDKRDLRDENHRAREYQLGWPGANRT